jgi:ABC-type multidrug transport system fused ATPase/permease subunit
MADETVVQRTHRQPPPIRDVKLAVLRRKIGVVFQGVLVFGRSIAENS